VIVGITGKRGSGKTSLAKLLETEWGFAFASFGDVVRAEARGRGLGNDLHTLQRLGATLIAEWGWPRFCAATLSAWTGDRHVAVEGVRHEAAVDGLSALAADDFLLVFVDLPDDQRGTRLHARGAAGETGLAGDRGETEREVDSLRTRSHLVVDGADLPAAAKRVVDLIDRRSR
jgi:hypothetical protein